MNWGEHLELAKKDQEKFITRGEKIVKRFRDERDSASTSSSEKKYNILWSNVKTLFPAVYARKPKAEVERRFKDADPVGRTASQILERALQYEIDHYADYDSSLRGSILDRLLPGRGVVWVRFEEGEQITDDVQAGEGESLLGLLAAPAQPIDPKGYECTPCDYVFWKDFRHSPARTWEEVTWVARRVYMTKEEVVARFGADFADVPLSHEPIGIDKDITSRDEMKKAKVWEIWDKATKEVIWHCEGYAEDLDRRPDPLGLDSFFPCPKPLFATLTTDTLIPVADYAEYQDQAAELDDLTQRIAMLTKAVKAVGVYDASQTGVQRLLQEGVDNTLIPVENWGAFSSSGGLKGTVDMLPMDMVVKALNELYMAKDKCKQEIYELTGMSDIIRGATNALETATAQQIKSQFSSLRLKETQQDVARFASDLLRMKAQVMSDLYRPEVLIAMSGIDQTEDAQYAQQAIELLRNDSMRCYRIEVATDSMVELDEQAEKASRVEFLQAAGSFLQQAVQAVQTVPEMAPLMGEMLMFGVRAFKASRPIEAAFEQAVQKLNAPQQPKPDPEQMKLQAQMQLEQVKLQAQAQSKQADIQASAEIAAMQAKFKAEADAADRAQEAQLEQMRAQMQAQVDTNRQRSEAEQQALKVQNEAQLAQVKAQYADQQHARDMEFQRWKAELDAATRIQVANISSKAKVDDPATQAATREVATEVTQPDFSPILQAAEQMSQAAALISKPKKRTIVRDKDGKATGMIEE